jgi:hypothetical protein
VPRCADFQPFQVWQFPYQFDGDPERVWKLWVVARNLEEHNLVLFFKPTSQTQDYDAEPSRLCGVVEYQAGELECFPMRTLIDPARYCVGCAHLGNCHDRGELRRVGVLPDDFRERMNAAAQNKEEWRAMDRNNFFNWFK